MHERVEGEGEKTDPPLPASLPSKLTLPDSPAVTPDFITSHKSSELRVTHYLPTSCHESNTPLKSSVVNKTTSRPTVQPSPTSHKSISR
ncbi:hypothetical protein Pcinc_006441 [Petrolisthes cinctipes]|uniref:Uncharacterized protein n=1 Tax=Petrolisthes cinctipes TaxID=88211 RepID=A0AAE1GD20_PETCI|nr:hypothetical protein Pcinc_006441 [Petrolisthes cinctipes]